MKSKMRALLAAALLILMVSGHAEAGFEEGMAAVRRNDYAAALKEWQPIAQQGNSNAQNNLGVMYEKGWGVPQDFVQAVQW